MLLNSRLSKSPMRWSDMKDGGYNFATAIGYTPEAYKNDTALYCSVAFQVTHNILDAFYSGRKGAESSTWWREGYAHTVRRRIHDQHNSFSSIKVCSRSASRTRRRTGSGPAPASPG